MNHLPQIITNLSDNDAYKYSMGQMFVHQFPDATCEWTYKNRDPERKFTREMIEEINYQLDLYSRLRYTTWELEHFAKINHIKGDYVKFLAQYTVDRNNITCTYAEKIQQPDIHFRGYNEYESYHEVPTMAIVSEVWFRMNYTKEQQEEIIYDAKARFLEKLRMLVEGKITIGQFSEFGTRRRFCKEFQEWALKTLFTWMQIYPILKKLFVGTSNVYFSFLFGWNPKGTMAHEANELVGQGYDWHNPAYSNYYLMKHWIKEYGVKNGIFLTDCITTDCFLLDFIDTYATVFAGLRHDSGDPIVWGEKMIAHYVKLGIDPKTKTLLFSDSLDFERASKIYEHFKDRVNVAFGIGTWLLNDTGHFKPMNQVIKLTEVNGIPVCKISDAPGKFMGKNEEYHQYLQRAIDYRVKNHIVLTAR